MATKKKIKKVGIVVVPRKEIDDRKKMEKQKKDAEKLKKTQGESDSTNYSRRNIKSYKKRTRISL